MHIEIPITLDVSNFGPTRKYITVKQGEGGTIRLLITLVSEGVEIRIPDTATVVLNCRRADGVYIQKNGDVADGIFEIVLPEDMLSVCGDASAEVQVITEIGGVLSEAFEIRVLPALISDDVIISSNEFSLLKNLISKNEEMSNILKNLILDSEEIENVLKNVEKVENKGVANGYAPLDRNGKVEDNYLYNANAKRYGVRWEGTGSTVCERLGSAVGLVANAHMGTTDSVQNDFDYIYPWSEMRLCNIDAEGNVLAYIDEPNFARDGSNGDVMVEIPKFYYKRVKTGSAEELWISGEVLYGYELHPVFINDGVEVDRVFCSAYDVSTAVDDNGVTYARSVSGEQPTVRDRKEEFRAYARAKGENWGIEDLSSISALQMLYLVEYADTNSQKMLGGGATNLCYTTAHKALMAEEKTNRVVISDSYEGIYEIGQSIEIGWDKGIPSITRVITNIESGSESVLSIFFDGEPYNVYKGVMVWNVAPRNGSCDELNGESGYIGTNGKKDVNYRGIEGFNGKNSRFIDGVNIKDWQVYFANSTADYADEVYDGKYTAVGYTNATSNGYISEFGYDENYPWVMFPIKTTGSSTAYIPDYYYQASGKRSLMVGGHFTRGAGAGAFFSSCDTEIKTNYYNIGAHLLLKKPQGGNI